MADGFLPIHLLTNSRTYQFTNLPIHQPPKFRDRTCRGSIPHSYRKGAFMTSRRFLPLLLVLFVGSGCAALIYEIVWFQLLELVIGSSAVSLAVLLGTFMGGMCLGSIVLPRVISSREHPLR